MGDLVVLACAVELLGFADVAVLGAEGGEAAHIRLGELVDRGVVHFVEQGEAAAGGVEALADALGQAVVDSLQGLGRAQK